VKAHASAPEKLAALDLTIDKLSHQLTRLKDKRVARHQARRRLLDHAPVVGEPGTAADSEAADGTWSGDEAVLMRTKRFEMKPMPPEEAALQLELLGHSFYLFSNAESGGRCAVIYRRRDGHLGLIEGG
jgi:putative sigma-54 modulation protein